jgi:hypothetical protein
MTPKVTTRSDWPKVVSRAKDITARQHAGDALALCSELAVAEQGPSDGSQGPDAEGVQPEDSRSFEQIDRHNAIDQAALDRGRRMLGMPPLVVEQMREKLAIKADTPITPYLVRKYLSKLPGDEYVKTLARLRAAGVIDDDYTGGEIVRGSATAL